VATMGDKHWDLYIEKMREVEMLVNLTAFFTLETARAVMEASYYAGETAIEVKKYLKKGRVKL